MKVTAAYLERVAREYQRAYEAANDKTAPALLWEKGWFKINGSPKRYRRAAIEEMSERLRGYTLPSTECGGK